MSFLKIGDRAAGAIKSGGTTRRAAKMVTLDVDHPDIEDFINWKVVEEQKVAALVAGSKLCNAAPQRGHAGLPRPRRRRGVQASTRKTPSIRARTRRSRRRSSARRKAMIPENYVQRVIQFAAQGYNAIDFTTYDTDWDSDAYLHRLRPELQQLGARHQRLPEGGHRRRRLDADAAHRRQRAQGRSAPATCGTRSATPPGPAPIRACSSTPPSTSGTPAPRRAASTRRTRARSTCSSTTRRATSRRSTCSRFRKQDGIFDVEAYEHAVRLWTIVLEISVLMAQFPSREIAQLSYDYRTLGLGYANIGGLLMASGLPYDCDEGRAHWRRAHRDPDRRRLRHLGRDGGRARRLPRLRARTARRCCGSSATTAAPPTASAERLRGAVGPAGAARHRRLPRRRPRRGGGAGLGPRARARRAARLPQRPGHGDRADRHHRPGHGLRHHRHRARLRAGEVQEARRRRLLQDHQPDRCRGALRTLGYDEAQIEEIVALRGRPRHADGRPGRQPRDACKARGFTEDVAAEARGSAGHRLRHQLRLQQVDPGRGLLHGSARLHGRASSTIPASTCWPRSASPGARSRRPTPTAAAP